ncbi:MAG: hypothetical protein RBR66_00540, partial [Candidatus Izemoplasmatales bacterium]|nr:hypothetical protein [Candidatus Izemoplasmatales bacterium]
SNIIPKIKISDNIEKITTPHFKKVYRIYSNGKAEADLITVHDETINKNEPLTIFDSLSTWKTKTYTKYDLKELHQVIFKDGKRIYNLPNIEQIREFTNSELNSLWDEVRRFDYPHKYYVDLSDKLWRIKQNLINQN